MIDKRHLAEEVSLGQLRQYHFLLVVVANTDPRGRFQSDTSRCRSRLAGTDACLRHCFFRKQIAQVLAASSSSEAKSGPDRSASRVIWLAGLDMRSSIHNPSIFHKYNTVGKAVGEFVIVRDHQIVNPSFSTISRNNASSSWARVESRFPVARQPATPSDCWPARALLRLVAVHRRTTRKAYVRDDRQVQRAPATMNACGVAAARAQTPAPAPRSRARSSSE